MGEAARSLGSTGLPSGIVQRLPAVAARVLPGDDLPRGAAIARKGSGDGAATVAVQRENAPGRSSPGIVHPSGVVTAQRLPEAAPRTLTPAAASPSVTRSGAGAAGASGAWSTGGPAAAAQPGIDAERLQVVQRVLARNAATYGTPAPTPATTSPTTLADAPLDVQRAEAGPAEGWQEEIAKASPPASAPAVSGGASGAGAASADAQTPAQLEKLIDRIYPPLVRRLKAEMLVDRERRGVRIDRI
ncbi:MAG TPA: hypothetical protein VFY91_16635 [Microbacterium sp.]|nr:hypothetical protein [Microbacterium sp.]